MQKWIDKMAIHAITKHPLFIELVKSFPSILQPTPALHLVNDFPLCFLTVSFLHWPPSLALYSFSFLNLETNLWALASHHCSHSFLLPLSFSSVISPHWPGPRLAPASLCFWSHCLVFSLWKPFFFTVLLSWSVMSLGLSWQQLNVTPLSFTMNIYAFDRCSYLEWLKIV